MKDAGFAKTEVATRMKQSWNGVAGMDTAGIAGVQSSNGNARVELLKMMEP